MCRFFQSGTCFAGSLLPRGFQLQTGFSKQQQPGCQAGDNKKGICPDTGDSAICVSVSCNNLKHVALSILKWQQTSHLQKALAIKLQQAEYLNKNLSYLSTQLSPQSFLLFLYFLIQTTGFCPETASCYSQIRCPCSADIYIYLQFAVQK